MSSKIHLFRTMIAVMLLCLLAWDAVLWLTGYIQPFPNRDAILTCTLIWIASVFLPQKNDDDWAARNY